METSASVCLRPVLPGRGSWTSCSSSRPGPGLASSQIAVSSRLLGETERCRNPPLQLVSTGKNKGCKEGEKLVTSRALRMGMGGGGSTATRKEWTSTHIPEGSCGDHSPSRPAGQTEPRPGAVGTAERAGKDHTGEFLEAPERRERF